MLRIFCVYRQQFYELAKFRLVYVAAKLVRIATALLKYGETFSFEKAGISKAVLKQWELEQAKAA